MRQHTLVFEVYHGFWVHERPAIHILLDRHVRQIVFIVFEYTSSLLISARYFIVLIFKFLNGGTRSGDRQLPLLHLVPIYTLEERMRLDFVSSFRSCPQPTTFVSVQEVHDQVLGFGRHGLGQQELAVLNVFEKFLF